MVLYPGERFSADARRLSSCDRSLNGQADEVNVKIKIVLIYCFGGKAEKFRVVRSRPVGKSLIEALGGRVLRLGGGGQWAVFRQHRTAASFGCLRVRECDSATRSVPQNRQSAQ